MGGTSSNRQEVVNNTCMYVCTHICASIMGRYTRRYPEVNFCVYLHITLCGGEGVLAEQKKSHLCSASKQMDGD